TVSIQDTQLTFVPNIDNTAVDTTIEIQTIEVLDTVVIIILDAPAPPPPSIKKAETTNSSPLFLLLWLLLFVALAWIVYKWLTTRWQKQYWLEYNAKLQPLATLSNSNSSIDFDFSELSLETTTLEQTDDILLKDIVAEVIEQPILIEPELPEVEEPKTISDNQTEDIAPFPKIEIVPADIISSTAIPIAKAPSNSHWITLFIIEFLGRLPRILFEIGRGMTSVFSFFSTGNQKRKPLDLKWQDGISVPMILLFIACKTVIFPYAPTSTAGNLGLGLLVWGAPALLRLHWGWGVLGILVLLGEFISLIIYIILQALKGAEPSDGDYTFQWRGFAVILSISLLYWANKKGWLPTFKSVVSFVLITIGCYFIFLPYIESWMYGGINFYGYGDAVARLIATYILYLVVTEIINPATRRKNKLEPVDQIVETPLPVVKSTDLETIEIPQSEKAVKPLSPQELRALFRTKNWYKKANLDQFESVSLPSSQLNEQSEFIVLYLPDCINLRQLYLSNNNFQETPYEISALKQLEILDLSYNKIDTISPEIEYLKNLKVLFLAHNNISKIPSELANLTQLTQIDLTGNPLTRDAIHQLKTDFPNIILKFDAPIEEDIPHKEIIKEVPKVVLTEDKKLTKIVSQSLYEELKNPEQVYALSTLMNKKLPDLPLSVFQEFPNLKSLFLNSNLFTEIPEAIYHLPALTTLGLSYNKITSLPDRISTLQNLKELDLSGNPIRSFSPAITQLHNLRKINLGNLGLTIFPAFLLKMQHLESINLTGNHILRIPKSIEDLSNLKELNLSFSGISTIPDTILALKNLRALEWTGNSLESIPSKIIALEKLEKLAIGFNENLESPTSILKGLPNLKELYISGIKGGMKKPMILNVGILKTLQTLWLNYNELQDLPISLFDLKQIRRLSLANNKLETLSERLGELSNLEYLYLEKNQLTALPNSIKKLKKLRHLNLANNPIDIKEKRTLQRILPHVRIQF
ncbi:MAG: leucine-rich repeat domain-containing protein, partial [Aureispira sp.]|nr:leucine-rich repeat domain-containing protein [Aureispira sp.]